MHILLSQQIIFTFIKPEFVSGSWCFIVWRARLRWDCNCLIDHNIFYSSAHSVPTTLTGVASAATQRSRSCCRSVRRRRLRLWNTHSILRLLANQSHTHQARDSDTTGNIINQSSIQQIEILFNRDHFKCKPNHLFRNNHPHLLCLKWT